MARVRRVRTMSTISTLPEGGKMKFSTYMKGVSGLSTIASAFPPLTAVALPVATISGGIGTVAGLLGAGLNEKELKKMRKKRGRPKKHKR